MFNRYYCSVRLGISKQLKTLLCIPRSFCTSSGDSTGSQSESVQRSKASGKNVLEIGKESRNTARKEIADENLKPANIRSNFVLNFYSLFCCKCKLLIKFILQRNYWD